MIKLKNILFEEIYIQNTNSGKYSENTDLGKFDIMWDNNPLKFSLKRLGYDSLDELLDEYDVERFSQLPNDVIKQFNHVKSDYKKELILLDWRSTGEGKGFALHVLKTLKKIADKIGVDSFRISMPSVKATQVLRHYVDKGMLEPVKDSATGLSDDEYYTRFRFKSI